MGKPVATPDIKALEKDFPFFHFSRDVDDETRIEEYGALCTEIDKRVADENRFLVERDRIIVRLQDLAWKRISEELEGYFSTHAELARNEAGQEFETFTGMGDDLNAVRYQISTKSHELAQILKRNERAWKPQKTGNEVVEFFKSAGSIALSGVVGGLELLSSTTSRGDAGVLEKEPPRKFLERIMDRHFSGKLLEEFMTRTMGQVENELIAEWKPWMEGEFRILGFGSPGKGPTEGVKWENPSVGVAKLLGLSAIGGTLALAMGWHTLAWASLHFFPPALIVAGVLATGWAFLKKEDAKKELEETVLKTADNMRKEIQRGVAVEAMPRIRESIDKLALETSGLRRMRIWGFKEDPASKVEHWRAKIIDYIDADQRKWTLAQAQHMMHDALEKGREASRQGDIAKATLYVSLAFDGFVHWSHKITGIVLNTYEKDYLRMYRERYEAAGWDGVFLEDFKLVNRVRNRGVHDFYKQDPAKYAQSLRDAFAALGRMVLDVNKRAGKG